MIVRGFLAGVVFEGHFLNQMHAGIDRSMVDVVCQIHAIELITAGLDWTSIVTEGTPCWWYPTRLPARSIPS